MKRAIGLLAVLLVLAGVPLGLAVVVTVIATPALAEQHRVTSCAGTIPATGDWRVPYVDTTYEHRSGFGPRIDPETGAPGEHTGLDLGSVPSGAPIVAVAAGLVVDAGPNGGYGTTVDVQHAGGILTRYAHLASIDPAVTVGDQVAIGQVLGVEGTTGRSTGLHLHLEVRLDRKPVDPVAFLADRGVMLSGTPVGPSIPEDQAPDLPGGGEGGIGFALPPAGEPRQASLTNPAQPVPARVQDLYEAAAAEYNLPWTLLAGVGMAETAHGATTATSTAGAQGLMQFMPATFATYGVDGDGDGMAQITNDADSVHSAANYLRALGAADGPDGVREALFGYNRADWYVNDVLHYAHAYGGGLVLAEPADCPGGTGDPDLPPISDERIATMLEFALDQQGDAYVLGANGPDAWDCSSLTHQAMARVGITSPRTAQAQRGWLATGNGYQVPVDQAQPGDLFFFDSYLGPNTIGHVGFVLDPATQTTFEAANPSVGVGAFSYADDLNRNIFQIWRLGDVADDPANP